MKSGKDENNRKAISSALGSIIFELLKHWETVEQRIQNKRPRANREEVSLLCRDIFRAAISVYVSTESGVKTDTGRAIPAALFQEVES